MTHTIQYEVGDDGIAILTIDLPGRSMNVLAPELLHDLETLTDRISSDDAVKGAVLTSGKKSFIAGADIMDIVTVYDRGLSPGEAAGFSRELNRRLRKLETCGKPVAAAINGLALGGGLEVCLACHYRVLADEPGVVVGFPEVNIGLIPGGGGTQRLPRLIGTEKALPLILQGQNIRPEKALELGIVHELAPAQKVVERAKQWLLERGDPLAPWDKKGFKVPGGAGAMSPRNAQTFMVGTSLLVGKTRNNYPAPIAAMSAVYEGCITPIDTGLDIEAQYFGTLLTGPVARNMMRSMFINKGAANSKLGRSGPYAGTSGSLPHVARAHEKVVQCPLGKAGRLRKGTRNPDSHWTTVRKWEVVVPHNTSEPSAISPGPNPSMVKGNLSNTEC